MAFDFNFLSNTGGTSPAPIIYTYLTSDNRNQVLAANYFNDASPKLREDDLIAVVTPNTELKVRVLSVVGRVVTVRESMAAKDFFVEVRKGNVPGHSLAGLVQSSPNITSGAFQDLWFPGGIKILASGAEDLEIVSSSATDAAAGDGGREVTFYYLDVNYARKSHTVTLNGTTPVAMMSDYFRNDPLVVGASAMVTSSGDNDTNAGDITIRRVSDSASRSVIPADEGVSTDGHFTVPLGFRVFLTNVYHFFPKNQSGEIRKRIRRFDNDTFSTLGATPLYQNQTLIDIEALLPANEKDTVIIQAKSDNVGPISVTSIVEVLIVEDTA